jgi:thioredoxin-like negative regulator of GroEL
VVADHLGTELADAIAEGYAARDRDDMGPTVRYFHALLDRHPGHPVALYEVGGAHDTAGDEELAAKYYEEALEAGLSGDHRRRCLIQYGSTLRNLDRHTESIAVLELARAEFPDSDSVRLFLALSLHAAGRSDAAIAGLLELATDRITSPEVARYEASLRGYAGRLAEQDPRP